MHRKSGIALALFGAVAAGWSTLPFGTASAQQFADPVRVEAAGKPIDTAVGHAAPYVTDFDGDGVRDLLVGQFGSGILWIYRNEGTDAAPRFAARSEFKGGRVPTG